MILPLLEGTDGTAKMSKSLGNYIGVAEPPAEIFGKMMSISDELMCRYSESADRAADAEARAAVAAGRPPSDGGQEGPGPELVARFHGAGAPRRGRALLPARFQQRCAERPGTAHGWSAPTPDVWICQLLKDNRQLRRLHLGKCPPPRLAGSN